MKYTDFVISKMKDKSAGGIDDVEEGDLSQVLFPFQRKIVRWALRRGRAALFEDCGLGKTLQQIEWARIVQQYTQGIVLIYAPLTVARQTQREAQKVGVSVMHVQFGAQIMHPGIYVTNYERHHLFADVTLAGIVLDESSILKNCDGKTRNALIEQAAGIPFRLCCTATPAPNDITEIANHAEFLGIKTRTEMLAHWFVHDDKGWRLKGHASRDFYRWLATWSVFLRDPSDIGEDATGYNLPELSVEAVTVKTDAAPDGYLFHIGDLKGVQGRSEVRKATITDRVAKAAELINRNPDKPWIVWCGLNDESDAIYAALRATMGDSIVRVEGNTPEEAKIERLTQFLDGEARVLITKPRVCGFGMNFQHCAHQVFLGLSDSWEAYYQCLRRSYRFGQTQTVHAYIVVTDLETSIVNNVMNKEEEAKTMGEQIIKNMGDLNQAKLGAIDIDLPPGIIKTETGRDFVAHNGDCVRVLETIASESVDLSVYSPPFATLYTYSDNPQDMGNCVNHEQFFEQFRFLVEQMFRVTKPGRITCVHVAQVTTTLAQDGLIGLNDFRGAVIEAYKRCGWVHYGEVAVDKCPQAQAIRTKAKALMFVQKNKDRSWSRPALADFVLVFRRPGDSAVPIVGNVTNEEWIHWARPVWYGIRETNTLNVQEARGDKDERHICPLQLDLIERCIRLWSNPGETVLSPFMGIGSEGYEAILAERKFVGIELKPEYFRVAVKNLRKAEQSAGQQDLFAV